MKRFISYVLKYENSPVRSKPNTKIIKTFFHDFDLPSIGQNYCQLAIQLVIILLKTCNYLTMLTLKLLTIAFPYDSHFCISYLHVHYIGKTNNNIWFSLSFLTFHSSPHLIALHTCGCSTCVSLWQNQSCLKHYQHLTQWSSD